MRRFMLVRSEDVTGVSGTGFIAEGVEFFDGTVALRWRTAHRSTAVYENMATLAAIHLHHGATQIEWVDP